MEWLLIFLWVEVVGLALAVGAFAWMLSARGRPSSTSSRTAHVEASADF